MDMPFRPYTIAEVADICKETPAVIDAFMKPMLDGTGEKGIIEWRTGDDGVTRGLDHQQCFAVFCALRWLREGCGQDRAVRLLVFLLKSDMTRLKAEIDAGRTFPALGVEDPTGGDLMVKAPRGRLGHECNIARLRLEFFDALYWVFPKTATVKTT
jgi:hypothetical protein